MDEEFVSIGKAAKMLGMSIEGLRKWERDGRLIPVRTLTNQRRYRVADLQALTHESRLDPELDTRCILYARVSTKNQQEAGDLDRQLGRLTAFAAERHSTVVAALTDVASGLDEKRSGLHQVLDLARERQAGMVVIEHRDRLTRFGFVYLKTFLNAFGVRIVQMDSTATDDQPELVEDLVAITAACSARLYGQRGGKKIDAAVRQVIAALAQEGVQE